MKTYFSCFLFLLFGFDAFSNHFIGADMTYTCISNGQYLITLTVYRDCFGGGPDLDDSYEVNFFNLATNELYGSPLTVSSDGTIDITPTNNDPCVEYPASLCLEKAVYTGVVNLPLSLDGYLMNFNDCCFAQSVGNIQSANNSDLSVSAIIPPVNQVSNACAGAPVFNEEPPAALCLYDELSLDVGATWDDYPAATLTYSFFTPDGNSGNTEPPFDQLDWLPDYDENYAIPSDSTIEINMFTGEITGTPMELGYYLMGVKVTAIENGETVGEINRVFRYAVVDCNINRSVAEFETLPICGELTVNFANESFGADGYVWNFDDPNSTDNTTDEEAPTHIFSDFGTYTVSLITSAGNDVSCSDTSYLEVVLEDGAESQIIVNNDVQCLTAQDFDFDVVSSQSNVTYEWEFGSNASVSTSTATSPQDITFNQEGIFTVILHTNYLECETTTSIEVEVFDGLLSELEGPTEGCAPYLAEFSATKSNPNYTYTWTIDGNTYTGEKVSHLFTVEDSYDITLHVVDESGCESTLTEWDFIDIYEEPEAGFVISDHYISAGEYVTVQNSVEGDVDIQFYIPELGYEVKSQSNFVYTFEEEGAYEVIQQVTNGACTNQIIKIVNVGPREVYPPNVFTPNEDQINDYFYINPYYNTNMEIIIYDRWGVEVFSSSNYELCNPISGEFCWDGRDKNGKYCKEGAYAYTLILQNGFRTNGFVQLFK